MSAVRYLNLADCTEFRQTLAARPPRIVHGTALLLLLLLGATITWAAIVKANLIVRAPGRVRSVDMPTRIFTPASADLAGRVLEAPFHEGDLVHRGDVLVRLDTARMDNLVAKLERTSESATEELVKLKTLAASLVQQRNSAKVKAATELAQAEANVAIATTRRESLIREAESDVKVARDRWQRSLKLNETPGAISAQQLVELESALHTSQEKLTRAKLPVDRASVEIARRSLELVGGDFDIRQAELDARIVVKQGECDAARRDLANLNIQRDAAVIRSPIDGVVVGGQVEIGDVLQPGKQVLELARENSYCFEALVTSEDVGELHPGMPVQIKFDTYDYQEYGAMNGTITYVSPDSKIVGGDESQKESSSSSEVRSGRAAFVVRVQLSADQVGRGKLSGQVKLGLGGTAEVIAGHETVLGILIKSVRHSISL